MLIYKDTMTEPISNDVIVKIFKSIDKDKDGYITRQEL